MNAHVHDADAASTFTKLPADQQRSAASSHPTAAALRSSCYVNAHAAAPFITCSHA
jgi:hypothetical protein